jgi:hypothetical protein
VSVEKPDDSIGRGVAIGVMVQAATIVSAALAVIASPFIYCLFAFGLVQWIGLVPFMMRDFKGGYRQSVKGMAIAGCIGLLLNSACAGMFFFHFSRGPFR